MKYFLVEGKFNNPIPVGGVKLDSLIKEHLERLDKEIKRAHILFTASKKNNSGIVFIIKSEERNDIDVFIQNDPLYKKEVQKYTITELKFNGISKNIKDWI